MPKKIETIDSLHDYSTFLNDLTITIGKFGGRRCSQKSLPNSKETYCINDLVFNLQILHKSGYQKIGQKDYPLLLNDCKTRINQLDEEGKKLSSSPLIWLLTTIKQLFGNLFFDRKTVMAGIKAENSNQIENTSQEQSIENNHEENNHDIDYGTQFMRKRREEEELRKKGLEKKELEEKKQYEIQAITGEMVKAKENLKCHEYENIKPIYLNHTTLSDYSEDFKSDFKNFEKAFSIINNYDSEKGPDTNELSHLPDDFKRFALRQLVNKHKIYKGTFEKKPGLKMQWRQAIRMIKNEATNLTLLCQIDKDELSN